LEETAEITDGDLEYKIKWTPLKAYGYRYLCAAQVRIDNSKRQSHYDIYADTTGLNSVGFKFCKYELPDHSGYKMISSSIIGNSEWENFSPSTYKNYFACGFSLLAMNRYVGSRYIDVYISYGFIYCNYDDWNDSVTPGSASLDPSMTYATWDYKCSTNKYIKSLRLGISTSRSDIEYKYIGALEATCSDLKVLKTKINNYYNWNDSLDLQNDYICGERMLSGLYGMGIKRCSSLLLYPGEWGKWSDYDQAESGYFACGMWAKYFIGDPKDSMGINGVALNYCHKDNWEQKKYYGEVTVNANLGSWDWAECPKGYYIIGGSVLNMPPQGSAFDDQSIVGVSITCKNPESNETIRLVVSDRLTVLQNHGLKWEKDLFGSGYVIGIRAKLDPTIEGKDATGVNGIEFKMGQLE
jgi:hypothetical protein